MADVSVKNVTKTYGKTEVIHGLSCDIRDGEFVVLLGPSGCGKSTMLRMIAGLEKISGGEVHIGGKLVNNLEPMERDIAMVFQNYALYPHMSVYNNMAYGLKIRRMPKAEIDQRVQKAAQMLGLTNLLTRKPRELSGGQRQRVAMGRCIVREPQVFLFDEPLSNLDAKLRVQMRLELRNLHEKMGITSIYVTHDQVEAMTLGDRMIIMSNGFAEQIGTPLEVYERPASKFVADFIGSPSMNFFTARVSADGRTAEISGTAGLPLSDYGLPTHRGQEVILGIRPEHFELTATDGGSLTLRVRHVENLGADTFVYGYIGDTDAFITARLGDIHHFKKDTNLSFRVPISKLHVFDLHTEKRIEH